MTDRIDRGDLQRVAHGGIGRRTAALAQHADLLGGAHDVPHDEEIAGQVEPRDDAQLVFELAFDFRIERQRIAFGGPAVHQRAQITLMAGFLGRNRKVRKLAAQGIEPERAALGDRERVGDRERIGREELGHLLGRFEVVFVVGPQQRTGFLQRGLIAHALQHVGEPRVAAHGVGDAVGCDVRHAQRRRQTHRG